MSRHVCFLTGTLNAMAGAERMTAVIANGLAELGHTVSILSLWDPSSCFPLYPSIRHEALFEHRPSFKRKYFATVAGIRRYCRTRKVDVLVQVDTMLSLFTLPATLGLGVEQIAWEHCHFDEDLGRPIRRFARRLAARYCSHVVVLTERDRRRWLEVLPPRNTIVVIPNPLPFPLPDTPAPRLTKTVLAMGRLVAAKGFDLLLQAWKLVADEEPEWRLVIHGEGPERAKLEALVSELGLKDSVSLPGICRDVRDAYRSASIFCLSSRYEGFGLVLIEAMAFGLPIVATSCEAGPKDLLEPETDALMVGLEHPSTALAEALLRVIHDPSTSERLGLAARLKAQKFTIDHISARWDKLLGSFANPTA